MISRGINAFLLFFYRSQCFIALAAATLVYSAPTSFGFKPSLHALVGLVFFSTYIEYNLSALRALLTSLVYESKPILRIKEKVFFLSTIFLSILACAYFFSKLAFASCVVFGVATVLAWFYAASFESGVLAWKGLRRFGILKLALIAGVWATVTLILPALESGIPVFTFPFALLLSKRLCFLVAITLPFDARDELQDRLSGVKTLAVLYGPKVVVSLSRLFLIVFLVLSALSNAILHPTSVLADILPALAAAVLVFQKRTNAKSDLYYMALDGTLLLMAFGALFTY